jgi:membrane-bound ClpP family serine protease
MSKTIIGIDPGNKETAIVMIAGGKIIDHAYLQNDAALHFINGAQSIYVDIYCEMIASYGMPVGKSVFETCLFIGQILQVAPQTKLITRNVVKNAICHSSKAKDANIRQALIDIYGEVGTKKNPGGTFGMSGDKWAALAVATAAARGAKLYELGE